MRDVNLDICKREMQKKSEHLVLFVIVIHLVGVAGVFRDVGRETSRI